MGETRGKYLFTVLHIVNMFFIRFLILIMLLILDEWMKEKSEKILKLCIVNIYTRCASKTYTCKSVVGNGNNNFEAKYISHFDFTQTENL